MCEISSAHDTDILNLDSLNMVNILSVFQPLIGEIGRVGISLALQNSILGHVESGVLWGDDDDWRTFLGKGEKNKKQM